MMKNFGKFLQENQVWHLDFLLKQRFDLSDSAFGISTAWFTTLSSETALYETVEGLVLKGTGDVLSAKEIEDEGEVKTGSMTAE